MLSRVLSLCVIAAAGACGLESGGITTGGPTDASVVEDRGTGMNEAGMKCDCVPPKPANFEFVAYQRDGVGACPADFNKGRIANEQIMTTMPVCSCDCTALAPATCTITNVTVDVSLQSNCSSPTTFTGALTNGCFNNLNHNPPSNIWLKGTATTSVTGGTCTKNETNTGAMLEIHNGRACTLSTPTAACPSGDSCVPAAAGFEVCVTADGDQACPMGYPKKHLVTAMGYHNDLGCKACTCTPAPTCAVQGSVFTDDNCSSLGFGPFKFDGSCVAVNAKPDVDSIGATVMATQACAKPMNYGNGITGSFFPQMPYTICCR